MKSTLLKIWNTYAQGHADKVAHFGLSHFIANILIHFGMNMWWAMVVVLILAVAKELIDECWRNSKASSWDIIAGWSGALVSIILNI